jgi:hypothetical protein
MSERQGDLLQRREQETAARGVVAPLWWPVAKRVTFRIVIPAALSYVCHEWAWNMLAASQFAVAFALLLAFAVTGLFSIANLGKSASRPLLIKWIKVGLGLALLLWTSFSAVAFWRAKGTKDWTTLFSVPVPSPTPILAPTSTPTPVPTATPTPTPTPILGKSKSQRRMSLEEERRRALKALDKRDVP